MSSTEARSDTPLLDVQEMRAEDGPSLSVAGDMPRPSQLQDVRAVFDLYYPLLLGMFC